MERKKEKGLKNRYALIDTIRGLALVSMIGYHGAWNLVYLYGMDWKWYQGREAFFWQQSICWTFILLSGFCWSMGRRQLKNGITVFLSGLLVTTVTLLVMPQNRVVFGVLTCIGSCSLLLFLLHRFLALFPPTPGAGLSFLFFILTYRINSGWLQIGSFLRFELPKAWYRGNGLMGNILTWLGFPTPDFYSTDYFSLFPWFFLFLTGYFLYHLFQKRDWMRAKIWELNIPPLAVLGRNSLLIYLLHQPLLYLMEEIFFLFF
ncbi:MAG: DUF1624 domain-containing protein [Lachnospiraceae bacterium]|nr:DUF1624 domain-containing protein [Lachnospiraceae bacterium]